MSIILGIDPGTNETGWAMYDSEKHTVLDCGIEENDRMEGLLDGGLEAEIHVVEWIESFGMPVGKEVFETVYFIGRISMIKPLKRITRRQVKLNLCNSSRAKDTNVRAAILDRFEPIGGGKTPVIGTKKQRGPLYGVTSHKVSALAVAMTYADLHLGREVIEN